MGESRGRTSRSKAFRKTWQWQQLRLRVITTHPPRCALPICYHPQGRTIDTSLSGRSKWGPQACHVIDVEDDPTGRHWLDPNNVVLGHMHCNVVEGLKRRAARKQEAARMRAVTIEAATMRVITHEIRGGGSNPRNQAPTKTWDPLESTCRHASLSIL